MTVSHSNSDPTALPLSHLSSHPSPKALMRVLAHWHQASGTFSKETFLALFGALVGWARELPEVWAIAASGGDAEFGLLAAPLERAIGKRWLTVTEAGLLPERAGCLVLLSPQGCAALSWDVDQRKALQMYHGGWTFRAADAVALAETLLSQLPDKVNSKASEWQKALTALAKKAPKMATDPRLPALTQALVQGLERQSHQLDTALSEVHHLNQKVVNSERLAAIGQLCSVVAHEIRNPLGLIDLYAKLIEAQAEKWVTELKETHPTIETEELPFSANITMVREAIQGLESILSELTQYSRPMEVDTQCVAVVPVVQNIVTFYTPKYQEKGVGLTLDYHPELGPTLHAQLDVPRFRQALLNLLKNALEASKPDTTVTVVVASRQNDRDIYIKVMDEGGGVPERAQEKLFTPYFSTKGNGTGLGLAHSRKILQAHGGSVELLRTETGVGSTFAIIVPRQDKLTAGLGQQRLTEEAADA